MIDAYARVELVALLLDQAARPKCSQVTAHRGKGHPRRRREIAGASRGLTQQVDYAAAARIGQRRECPVEFVGNLGSLTHLNGTYLNQVADSISWLLTFRTCCQNVQR